MSPAKVVPCLQFDLNPCVGIVLQTLGPPLLTPLKAAINTQLLAISGWLIVLEQQLVVVDVLTVPLTMLQSAANIALAKAREGSQIIVGGVTVGTSIYGMFQNCADLSTFNLGFSQFVGDAFAVAQDIVRDIDRLNFTRLLIEASITELNGLVEISRRVVDCIDEILLDAGDAEV